MLSGRPQSRTEPLLRGVVLNLVNRSDPAHIDHVRTWAEHLLWRADAWCSGAGPTAPTVGLAMGRQASIRGQYNDGVSMPHGTPQGRDVEGGN